MGCGLRLCSEPTPFKLTKYFARHGMHISTAKMATIGGCAGELLLLPWLWPVSDNRARFREGVQLSTLEFYLLALEYSKDVASNSGPSLRNTSRV